MAGRLLIQKLSSGVYRSTGHLGRAIVPVARTASEGGISTLSNVFHGAAVHPGVAVTSSSRIHGYAARSFSIVPCSRAEVRTIRPVKRAFSSNSFNKQEVSSEPKITPRRISVAEHTAALKKSSDTVTVLAVLTGWIYIANNI